MAGLNVGAAGLVPVQSLSDMLEQERREAETKNNTPVVQSLAHHVRAFWSTAQMAKMQTVEERLLKNLRQRRGEYEADVLAEIAKTNGSTIYMMITGAKCSAASAWLKDTLLGARDEKPWTIDPSPIPDLPPDVKERAVAEATQQAMVMYNTGMPVDQNVMMDIASGIKDRLLQETRREAKKRTERMELKMEDQMAEGGFNEAFMAFLDDLTTFPSAIIQGPIMKNRPTMQWQLGQDGNFTPVVTQSVKPTWARVDPFMWYPAPHCAGINDGDAIHRHHLTRQALNEMIGVPGYNDAAIRAVLEEYGKGGLRDWLYVDTAKAQAEGKSVSAVMSAPSGTIDALQYWGSVQGKMLLDWGMDPKQIADPTQEYHCEVWLIGRWVIKAILNYDPFYRKPYFKASFEEIPGSFWGNAVPDKMRDCQAMCNYAARAIANNMGLSSGPQVGFNTDRLPGGEDLTELFPWKIWQFTSDPYGSTAKPIEFFQPASVAGELLQIFDKFSIRADEDTGIPRYMTGDNAGIGGAGRTASGMSMLMGNAGKTIKQVVANVDTYVIKPLVERLYFFNMRYSDDQDLKGDVNIIPRGANSLVVKDSAQVRRNEFLQTVINSPIVQQVVGIEGVAALLREQAKTLDMDADKIVPDPDTLRAQQAALLAQQQVMLPAPGGALGAPPGNNEPLMTGEPATDNFAPQPV